MRHLQRLAMFVVLFATACSGGSSSSGTSSSSTSAATSGPPTADLTFVGDAGLAGGVTNPVVSCNYPSVDGTSFMLALMQPSDPNALFNMHLSDGHITVVVATGSGTDYRSRQFEGTGITGFDAAKGAQIDSTLTETTVAGGNPGSLGAITSMKGTIDCGNQTAGSTTVTFTGETPEGTVNSGPSPFRTECDSASSGGFVSVVGIVTIGTTKTLFITNVMANRVSVFETASGIQHQYVATTSGVGTLSSTGAHVSADVAEQSPPSGTAHTLHVEGDITCGAFVNR